MVLSNFLSFCHKFVISINPGFKMSRQAIPDSQKKALQEWYKRQYPKPRQRDCIPWFKGQFNHQISPSTVCVILSDCYQYLDQESSSSSLSFWNRSANWPILEEILYDWQQIIQNRGGTVTGDILIEKAWQIWHQIPQYQGQPIPEFSVGWLAGLKKCYKIQQQNRHGEASSVSESAAECYGFVREPFVRYSAETSSALGGEDYTQISCSTPYDMFLPPVFRNMPLWRTNRWPGRSILSMISFNAINFRIWRYDL